MIILPDRHIPRSKFLLPIQLRDWRTSSQAQPKNSVGQENQQRFCVTARIDDGHIVWRGWFDDRDDFDQFLWVMANGNLSQDRATQRLCQPWWNPDLQELPARYEYHIYQFLTIGYPTTAGWPVPGDCNGISGQSGEFIDGIGAGGKGGLTASQITGGSGGAWVQITTLALTPGGSVFTSIGVRAADTWLNKTTNAAPASTTDGVLAKGGADGNTAGTAVAGGLASASVGTTKNSGGGSGSASFGASGGGASASPTGVGGTSAAGSFGSSAGGSSPGGGAGSAGVGSPNTSPAGGDGTQYDGSHGTGGGSGGGSGGSASSGRGGLYGAGSGGSDVATGTPGPGLLVIVYVPIRSLKKNLNINQSVKRASYW